MPIVMQLMMALYFLAVIGVSIFVLVLFVRFVRAHERLADAAREVARKVRDGTSL